MGFIYWGKQEQLTELFHHKFNSQGVNPVIHHLQ